VNGQMDHISVCVCTYQRPALLKKLLEKLQYQKTEELFGYSVVVVDNDKEGSARETATDFQKNSSIALEYDIESQKGIPMARNRALKNARGSYVAFIDDDELPGDDWLLNLYKASIKYNADAVLGPVRPYFETMPPGWIVKGKFFERPEHETGTKLRWEETRSGNVLLKRSVFEDPADIFNPAYLHGEDKELFRRMIEKGRIFVWCNEAPAYETQLPHRFKRMYFLKRALVRGNFSFRHQSSKLSSIMKSIVALPAYSATLPFLLLVRHDLFMKYLIKDCDHLGKLMAACGLHFQKLQNQL
jgi:succinoglycan biosynthesis protein ExoM